MNSYPQAYPQASVDDATHRCQSLTECQCSSLYLKDNKLLKIKINKKIINIKIKNNKNLLAIPMSILILTVSTTTEVDQASKGVSLELLAGIGGISGISSSSCVLLLVIIVLGWVSSNKEDIKEIIRNN